MTDIEKPNHEKKNDRLYYVDWCKTIGIHVVLIEHGINTASKAVEEDASDPYFMEKKLSFTRFLNQIGIPIFIFMSGMSAAFFNVEKPGVLKRYTLSKFNRLFVPLVVMIFMYHIPRHYMGQKFDPIGRLDNETRIENNFFAYVPQILADNFLTKLGPLWFLLALLFVSMLSYPQVVFSKRRQLGKVLEVYDFVIVLELIFWIGLWTAFCYVMIEDTEKEFWQQMMPGNVVLFASNIVFFWIQIAIQDSIAMEKETNKMVYIMILFFAGPISMLGLCYFHPGNPQLSFYSITMMLNYHTMFYMQGTHYQLWYDHLYDMAQKFRESMLYPVSIPFNFLVYGILQGGNYSDVGVITIWPIYYEKSSMCLYCLGTWQIIHFLLVFYKYEIDKQYDKYWYDLLCGSSMFVYLVHDFWQTIPISLFVMPNLKEVVASPIDGQYTQTGFFDFKRTVWFTIVISEIMSILNYVAFVELFKRCRRKRSKKEEQ